MSDPFERFFDIQELLDLLTAQLGKKDVSHLARTNRKLHRLCTPSLFKNLEVVVWSRDGYAYQVFEILTSSAVGRKSLARNVRHIRNLTVGVNELAYFYTGILAFQETNSHTGGSPTARPTWLPLPDTDASQLVPLPLMTNLSRLDVHMDKAYGYPYTAPNAQTPRTTLAQLSWLISIHPGLRSLELFKIPIADIRGGHFLGRMLSRMSNLDTLRLEVHCGREDWFALCSHLYFSCPPSLKHLSMVFFKASRDDAAIQDWSLHEEEEGEKEVTTIISKQEPLINMESMRLWGMYGHHHNAATDRSMFAHCPNVKTLELSSIIGLDNIGIIGDFIGKDCPKIESIRCSSSDSSDQGLLVFRILNSLPKQQVATLEYDGRTFDYNSNTVALAIQQHSMTLRNIRLVGANIDVISASAILRDCRNLEILYIPFTDFEGFYVTLDGVLKHPWNCTKLTQLTIAIRGCEMPAEAQSYYRRPVPITLSAHESQHLARLETLYQRIGALTALEDLNLTMVPVDEFGEVDLNKFEIAMSFPAMLNLADPETGRPGYLHHFTGLGHLKGLLGSVCANTAETKVTMGWPEVTWMDKHWPRLEWAWFFNGGSVTEPFKWFQDQRKNRSVDKWTPPEWIF